MYFIFIEKKLHFLNQFCNITGVQRRQAKVKAIDTFNLNKINIKFKCKKHYFNLLLSILIAVRKQYIDQLNTNPRAAISMYDYDISQKCETLLNSEHTFNDLKGSVGKYI